MAETGERILQSVLRDLAADVQSMQRYILALEEGRTQKELLQLRGRVAPRPQAVPSAAEVTRGN